MSRGKKKKSNVLINILLVAALGVFVFSGYKMFSEIIQKQKEQDAFEQLAQQVVIDEKEYEDVDIEQLKLERYAQLKEKNPHFVGWIRIDGTKLDYPVVHTPDNPEYYLRRNFDGGYAISGTPFVGEGCTVDSKNVLIYGHRMNNDTMFTVLLDYAEKEFWENHKEIKFDTVDRLQTYEIVSAFYIDIPVLNDPEAFYWYRYSGDITGADWDYYVQQVKAHAYYDTGIEISDDDRLLTLTTCAYNSDEQRFVVVARQKQ
ncbi:MAG: class B sortase [Oscillospiraceae bacterium]|nr:class B sortase [Oscillospiraceae bacterium]